MSQPTHLLEERVTQLEAEMADVRFLATKADREVSDVQITLRGYTGTLNAIRDDQVEQGKRLARVEKKVDTLDKKVGTLDKKVDTLDKKMDKGFAKVDENFARVDDNFAKVERKFTLLHEGQERITELLNRHLGEPDDEMRAGGTGE